jgi:hypothetical protein
MFRRPTLLALLLCFPLALCREAAWAQHDHVAIWSDEPGGGALTLEYDFDDKIEVFRSFCLPAAQQCLYTSINPAFLAPTAIEDVPDDGLFPLVDDTRLSIEIVAIDSVLTLSVNGNRLDREGERATLGVTPNLHTHPSWQVLVPEDTFGDFHVSYRITSENAIYNASEIVANVVTNLVPTPEPTATPTPQPITCPGDCTEDGTVTVDEIIRAVNIALTGIDDCFFIDIDHNGAVTVDEIIAAVTAALEGCEPEPTPEPVSLQELQDTIFTPTCLDTGCHNAADHLVNLVLEDGESHDNLVNVTPENFAAAANGLLRVDPGHPENSFLLIKLVNPRPEHGSRMPLDKPPLEAEEIERIRNWILQGALP